MAFGVGISGMGRIGRLLIRTIGSSRQQAFQLKAINSIYPAETVAHLLKYDSVHGRWDADISVRQGKLHINGNIVEVAEEREPADIGWSSYGVELAIDATGQFNNREGAQRHLSAGASRVLLTAPGREMDLTVVMGVNDHRYDPAKHRLVSAASCTTNCLAPVLHLIDQAYSVQSGWMTTVHAFTSDQKHLDNPHRDLRRARACTQSIVPAATGAGQALADVLPHLADRVQGLSLRVPTPDVSLLDLTVTVSEETDLDQVKELFRQASSSGPLSPYIGYSEEPLVSIDYIGCPKSAVIDGDSLFVMGKHIKVLAWYDNEWAYAGRVIDLAGMMASRAGEALHAAQPEPV
ncbi:glyceraldehyde 3-phosphate dehydrogenase [Paenibacillus sp. UNCCL117]|uniref:type I glyceraldehyde-3-phosphate dehydrogenase n=1 Tax=unclassified Paenibacillus TaxID=185978 RepID=UPI000889ED0A|nr:MULTISPECIES: type I glyceraldehyde-3-phosphate dehydrogenase [unclassified Paenibacillus]SDD29785.1 glyceraldehyde 3-phosphate dehydrogenase [Paenibacillus sp. cl123]SFW40467.1 glyceraldehyde 3-phosphate dehydrogenase [Paenibacillus sp. UNCCL117]